MLRFLTDFADQGVILPLAAVVLVALLLVRWRRGALAWACCVLGTLGALAVAKVAVRACGPLLSLETLRSPSGHTGSAAVVYGGLVVLLAGRASALFTPAMAAPVLAALLAGWIRVALDAHSVPDVLAGGAIGIVGGWMVQVLAGPRPPAPLRAAVGVAALLAALLLNGQHINEEDRIAALSRVIWPFTLCLRG